MEFKYIFFRKQPFCRFMHSLRKNENISMWGKRIAPQQKKLLPFLPGSLLKNGWITKISDCVYANIRYLVYAKFYVAEARMNSYGVRLLCNMKLFQQAKEKEVSFLLGLPRITLLFGFCADSLL